MILSTMTDMVEILNQISNLGLEEKEAQVYLALLQYSEVSILELSKTTGIPRSSMYRVVDNLKSGGFVYEVESSDTIKAIKPDSLSHLVENKQLEVELIEQTLASLEESIKDIAPISLIQEKVSNLEGIQTNLKSMLEDCQNNALKILVSHRLKLSDVVSNKLIELSAATQTKIQILYSGNKIIDSSSNLSIRNPVIKIYGFQAISDNQFLNVFQLDKSISGFKISNNMLAETERVKFNIIWQQAQ